MHDAAAAAATTTTAKGKPRKIRLDQKTLHTVVASHPYTVAEVRADARKAAEIREWERLTVAWLTSQYGPALKSVVRHTDEKHWHIHAFAVPTHDRELRLVCDSEIIWPRLPAEGCLVKAREFCPPCWSAPLGVDGPG